MRVRVEFGYHQTMVAEIDIDDSIEELVRQYNDREGEWFDELESEAVEVDGGYDEIFDIREVNP